MTPIETAREHEVQAWHILIGPDGDIEMNCPLQRVWLTFSPDGAIRIGEALIAWAHKAKEGMS